MSWENNDNINNKEIYNKSVEQNLIELSEKINKEYWNYDKDWLSYRVVENDEWKKSYKAEVKWEILDYVLTWEQLVKVLKVTNNILSSYYKEWNSNQQFYIEWEMFKDIFLDDSFVNDTDILTYEWTQSLLNIKNTTADDVKNNNKTLSDFSEKYTEFLNKITPKKGVYIWESINSEEINNSIDLFNWMNLATIKEIISLDESKREKNSLIFLKNVIENWYIVDWWDTLNFIMNFTPKNMKVKIIDENITSWNKLTFTLRNQYININENWVKKWEISINDNHFNLLK